MKPKALATVLFCFFYFFGLAQSKFEIRGSVADSMENLNLSSSTVIVLNVRDSILKAFTWTDKNGKFAIKGLTKGSFRILVTSPGYTDYSDTFTLTNAFLTYDLGKINMILKSNLLKDVLIKGQVAAILIKGDTTEFNSRVYKIRLNDKVEDLLKQLPGIEVDKDGKITARGQAVKKVLVDGEEFFGDDPTLVTQNIRADMVDKIQLYDKKSDQATFTGIDDGVKIKTINVKLKEDKKNGYFGKVDGEIGNKGYNQSQLLFNRFKSDEKFSAYANIGNTGKTGLNWQDNTQYGGGDGGFDDLDSYDGYYDGRGNPLSKSAGSHYDGKFNDSKTSVNANYKIGSVQVDGNNSLISQNNLPDSILNNNSNKHFHKFIFRQKLDMTLEKKLDTTSNIKAYLNGLSKYNTSMEDYAASAYVNNSMLLNVNGRTVTNRTDQKAFIANIFYSKKLKKKGRTISVYLSQSYNQSTAKGYLNSNLTLFAVSGKIIQTINQYKTNDLSTWIFNNNVTYTEPITKNLSLISNFSYNIQAGHADRRSYDSTAPNLYGLLDTAFSSEYKLNQHVSQIGTMLSYSKKQHLINFGTRFENATYDQLNLYGILPFNRKFINWQPQVNYQYRLAQESTIKINYNGNTSQPSIEQLQPLKNNTDPSNIILGNPYLTPSFSNNFTFSYNSYQFISEQAIFINASYGFTSNAIVSNNTTDNTGRTIFEAVNLPEKKPNNFSIALLYSKRFKPSEFGVSFNLSANGGESFNKTNDVLNITHSYTYAGQFSISQYHIKKYQLSLGLGPNYTINEASLQQQSNNNGKGFNAMGNFTIYLPFRLIVNGNGNFQFIAKTDSFDQDFTKFLVNATLTKAFFAAENLKLQLTGNDLLNQNIGFNRYVSGNVITQSSYTTIKRYFMIAINWEFNKMGGKQK